MAPEREQGTSSTTNHTAVGRVITDDFLLHFGVQGMHWGQRRAAKATAKADKTNHKNWKKDARSRETADKVFNEASKTMKPVFKKLNADPNFKDYKTNRKTQQQYDEVVAQVFNQHMAKASLKLTAKSFGEAIGTRAMVYQYDRHTGYMHAVEKQAVFHSTQDSEFPSFKVITDSNGLVIGFEFPDAIAHTDVIEHFGVKGQKWGVKKQTKKTPPSIHKKLNDAELKKSVERLRLEQQHVELTAKLNTKQGSDFTKKILSQQGAIAASAVTSFAVGAALKGISNRIKK